MKLIALIYQRAPSRAILDGSKLALLVLLVCIRTS